MLTSLNGPPAKEAVPVIVPVDPTTINTTVPIDTTTSNIAYVNKTGPKRQAYDMSQGGVKKYKESYQSGDALAAKSSAVEPLCMGRNQMIIFADKRINSGVYMSRLRTLQVTDSNQPNSVTLAVQTINFLPTAARFITLSLTLVFAAMALFTWAWYYSQADFNVWLVLITITYVLIKRG